MISNEYNHRQQNRSEIAELENSNHQIPRELNTVADISEIMKNRFSCSSDKELSKAGQVCKAGSELSNDAELIKIEKEIDRKYFNNPTNSIANHVSLEEPSYQYELPEGINNLPIKQRLHEKLEIILNNEEKLDRIIRESESLSEQSKDFLWSTKKKIPLSEKIGSFLNRLLRGFFGIFGSLFKGFFGIVGSFLRGLFNG